MSRFVLTAQIQLQAPGNSRDILRQIRSELGSGRPVSIPVQLTGASEAQRQMRSLAQETERAASSAEFLGRNFGIAVRRFAAFTVASRAVSLFTNSLANAIDDAIDFQREVVKISQVTGDSVQELRGLQNTITNLSVSLGTSSKDLLAVTRIFSQAGIRGKELEIALSGIAKSTLAPTFENITDTAEGAVAIISQFEQGVRSLESQLGSINAVAGQFAVESDDLIGAVRRFGGVFKASGGSLEELLAVFTSVRATTRESAETISTGLRTIFTRIQRPKTIQFLENLGIKLTDLEGKFVGPFEASQRLGQALEGLTEGDTKFIAIAEELGGFRQIGKVIPLLRQYKLAQEALNTAQSGTNSLSKDAETAQQALAVQITKVKEEFFALVRGIAEDTTFQVFVKTTLALASGFIKVAEALKPLLPIIASFAAFSFAKGVGGFFSGVSSGLAASRRNRRRSVDDSVIPFARGGFVPGSGNRDTVPAMLTPGEFVIRKSSVKKIGVGNLAAMNENRYNKGGSISSLGGVASKTSVNKQNLKSKRIENLGLQKDKYVAPVSKSYYFAIPEEEYAKLAGKGLGWEKWLNENVKSLRGKLANTSDPKFPVDFIVPTGLFKGLVDAKDKPLKDNKKERSKKALNYLLYKNFGKKGYRYADVDSNTINLRGNENAIINGTQLTPGSDKITLPPIYFAYPDVQRVDEEGNIQSSFYRGRRLRKNTKLRGYNSGGQAKEFWQMTPEEQAEERKRLQQLEDERSIQRSIGRSQTPTWRDENMRRGNYRRGYKKYGLGGEISPEIIEQTVQDLRNNQKTKKLSQRGRSIKGLGTIAPLIIDGEKDVTYGGLFLGPRGGPRPDVSGVVRVDAIDKAVKQLPSYKILQRIQEREQSETLISENRPDFNLAPEKLLRKSLPQSRIKEMLAEADRSAKLEKNEKKQKSVATSEVATRADIFSGGSKAKPKKTGLTDNKSGQAAITFKVIAANLKSQYSDTMEGILIGGILNTVESAASFLGTVTGTDIGKLKNPAKFLKSINIDNIVGNVFEGSITRAGTPYAASAREDAPNSAIDFPFGIDSSLGKAFNKGDQLKGVPTDAKAKYSSDNLVTFIKKIKNFEAQKRVKNIDEQLKIYAKELAVSAGNSNTEELSTEDTVRALKRRDEELSKTAKEIRKKNTKTRYAFLGGPIKLNKGSFGRGVKGFGPHRQPLVDDLKNTPDALIPNPKVAIAAILSSGYASLDLDRTLFRTIGDQAYMKAKTDEQRDEVLKRYFRDPVARLNDVRTAKLTQFGEQLRQLVKKKKIDPSNLSIISKSSAVPGLKEYVSQVFGIPTKNMEFTSGGEKSVALDRNRVYGPASKRKPIKRAAGGGISSSDTVPALLTPGEFVINKKSAEKIGYGNLNRMNKQGVVGFNKGGGVKVQKFKTGTGPNGVTASGGGGLFSAFSKTIGLATSTVTNFFKKIEEQNATFDSFKRGSDAVIKTQAGVEAELKKFIQDLGSVPEEVSKTLAQTKIVGFDDKAPAANLGIADRDANVIGHNYKKAGANVVRHEAGHIVSGALGRKAVKSGRFKLTEEQEKVSNQRKTIDSANIEGTFQNKVAKKLKEQFEKYLNEAEKQTELMKYRLSLEEIIADVFEKVPPEVKNILASTVDAEEGSKKLAEFFKKNKDFFGGEKKIEGLAALSSKDFAPEKTTDATAQAANPTAEPKTEAALDDSKTTGTAAKPDPKPAVRPKTEAALDDSKTTGESSTSSAKKLGKSSTKPKNVTEETKRIASLVQEKKSQESIIKQADSEIPKLETNKEKLEKNIKDLKDSRKGQSVRNKDFINNEIKKKKKELEENNTKTTQLQFEKVNAGGNIRSLDEMIAYEKSEAKNNKQSRQQYKAGSGTFKSFSERANEIQNNSKSNAETTDSKNCKCAMLIVKAIKEFQKAILSKGVQTSTSTAGSSFASDEEFKKAKKRMSELNKAEKVIKSDKLSSKEGARELLEISKEKEALRERFKDLKPGRSIATDSSDGKRSKKQLKDPIASGGGGGLSSLASGGLAIGSISASLNTIITQFGDKSIQASDEIADMTIAAEKAVGVFTLLATVGVALKSVFTGLGDVAKKQFGKGTAQGNVLGGLAKTFQLLSVAGGVAFAALTIFSESVAAAASMEKRRSEIAQDRGDVNEAVERAGSAAQMEAISKRFSIGGFIANMVDPEGVKQANELAAARAKADAATSAITSQVAISEQQLKFGGGDVDQITDRFASSAQSATAALSGLKKGTADEIAKRKALTDAFKNQIKVFSNANLSQEKVIELARKIGGQDQQLVKELVSFAEATVAARDATRALAEANIDSLKISSAFGAAAASVQSFVENIKNPGSQLANTLSELEANFSSAGVDTKPLIDSIENQLLSSLPKGSSLGSSVSNQANLARGISDFSLNIGRNLSGAEIDQSSVEAAREDIKELFKNSIPDNLDQSTKNKLGLVINDVVARSTAEAQSAKDIDLSKVAQQISEQSRNFSKGLFESAKILANHNKLMLGLYQERQKLEETAARAANEAISLQIEAAENIQEFGGPRLGSRRRREAAIAQFNNIGGLNNLGVSLDRGDAADILNASSQINQAAERSRARTQARISGINQTLSPQEVVSSNQSEQAVAANKELIQFTKTRIGQLKTEIELIKEKNKAEKDALEKLITGDIEGFIQGQAAAGAAAALRSGSKELVGLFSGSALGRGFQSLENQKLTAQERKRAAGLTLQRFGLGDNANSAILAGLPPEAEKLAAQGRDLSAALGQIAADSAAMASAEIQIQDATINAANLNFERKMSEVISNNTAPAAGLSGGGIVYANRGIFVPRGTDTVPAMLTPGEFVVNRSAVRRGNNLQILRAMNSGNNMSVGATKNMRTGGQVGYYNNGGIVDGIASAFSNAFPQLTNIFNGFSSAVDKLVTSQLSLRLDTTNINVNLNGGSFLEKMKEDVREELMAYVSREIGNHKPNSTGDLQRNSSVLGR